MPDPLLPRHCMGSLIPDFTILQSYWVENIGFGMMAFDRRSPESLRTTRARGQNSMTLALLGTGEACCDWKVTRSGEIESERNAPAFNPTATSCSSKLSQPTDSAEEPQLPYQ